MISEEIKNLGNIVFNDRDISPTQLGITSRKINYWLDHNLVPFVEKHQNVKNTETISKEAATNGYDLIYHRLYGFVLSIHYLLLEYQQIKYTL